MSIGTKQEVKQLIEQFLGKEKKKEIIKEAQDIVPISIDLGVSRRGELNESFAYMFAGWISSILGNFFKGIEIPVSIKGTRSEVESFAKALGREKSYIDAFRTYGLDDPRTYKSKSQLDNAIGKFEKTTKIKWPFK